MLGGLGGARSGWEDKGVCGIRGAAVKLDVGSDRWKHTNTQH